MTGIVQMWVFPSAKPWKSIIHTCMINNDMTTGGKSETRHYRMTKRARDIEETRRKIVEAAVELHGTVGPANTTFSAVADTAGVQRSTVYRHFPDEQALFGACTSHWLADHPWPRPEDWADQKDPKRHLNLALGEIYSYYQANEQMLFNSFRDVEVMPPFVGEFMGAQIDRMHAALLEPWGERADARLSAAVGHAMDFRSWQSLTSTGLASKEAAELMTEMVACLVRP